MKTAQANRAIMSPHFWFSTSIRWKNSPMSVNILSRSTGDSGTSISFRMRNISSASSFIFTTGELPFSGMEPAMAGM